MPIRAAMALAAVALTVMSAPAHAQALLSATATIDNLSYRLVDLDANDGITPWVAFGAGQKIGTSPVTRETQSGLQQVKFFSSYVMDGLWNSGSTSLDQTVALAIDVFDPQTVSMTDTAGLASFAKGPASISTQLALTAEQLTDSRLVGSFGRLGLTGEASINTVLPLYNVGFLLSPKTELVIEGDFSASVMFDEAALRDSLKAYLQGPTDSIDMELQSGTGLMISGRGPGAPGIEVGAGTDVDVHAQLSQTGSTVVTDLGGALSQSEHRTVLFTNVSTQNTLAGMNFGVFTAVNLSSTASAVPEPATWALMGLGLVGMTAVARRRRQS